MKRIIRRSFLLLMVLMFCTSFVFAAGNKEASKKKIDTALDKWLKEAQLGDYAPKQENWAETVKKATAEGKVVIYSSSSRIHRVKDLFEKTYPGIKLEAYNIESLKLVEKFGREYKSGIYNVDVIFNHIAVISSIIPNCSNIIKAKLIVANLVFNVSWNQLYGTAFKVGVDVTP